MGNPNYLKVPHVFSIKLLVLKKLYRSKETRKLYLLRLGKEVYIR